MPDALSTSDPLTGLKSSRCFRARLEEACAEAAREGTPLSLLVLDVDHFGWVNELHGRALGDQVLAAVARALASAVRGSDTTARLDDQAARTGGGELAVLLPGTGLVAAVGVGERVLRAVRESAVSTPVGDVRVTASAGLASTEPGPLSAAELYGRAEAALRQAKDAGRDRLAVHGAEVGVGG
jgi:diguanylate cyclase (GGDEF)-like protein